MSKDILVNKGDTLTVIRDISKLVTNLSNGSMATWIPEDETLLVTKTIVKDGTYEVTREPTKPYGYSQVTVTGVGNKIMGDLGEKSITKNGVYIAKQDKDGPFYGYSKLYVNVPGGDDGSGGGSSSPTITGKDSDGDDAIVGTDEDGKIVTSKLPTRISINVYPNNLVYEDGQTIDFTGLRVKAFLPDGTEWGIVDDNELIKPVTVASFDGETADTKYYDQLATPPTDLIQGGVQIRVLRGTTFRWERPSGNTVDICVLTCNQLVSICRCKNAIPTVAGKYSPIIVDFYVVYPDGSESSHSVDSYTSGFTYDGKTAYFGGNSLYSKIMPDQQDLPIRYNGGPVAWSMLYGEIEDVTSDSQQTVPLQWKRPGDKKVLETSFTIAVHGSGDSGSGTGPAPTPSPG